MKFKTATAQECAADFVQHVWPTLFKGNRGNQNKEWAKVRAFVKEVERGEAGEERIAKCLREYGGDRYKIGMSFKIKEE